MTVVSVLVFAMLGTGVLFALVRLALGPSLLDRVVATDALLVIISAGLAVYAALTRDRTVVPVLVVVALLGFVGTISVARYVGGMLPEPADDPGTPGATTAGDAPAEEVRP
ncbi:monovalent cation/H+ antiporter complex subunit F [Modestobacter sp. VKM Ac-2986]|uniref:monovalent cation/H+ antiporter complex subunit F n=1 Tax=Modestobacter sp. VKM Ac-2986 TaxID=3004140 RepID=UPI0022AB5547|nr:monovalent cation/H+ antiporter complex subunit F [Modestobacter sp. VKM Ac-2986]MCZ2829793.1 monovalent cation/H+ antiporter complex subunit F [Modestobacter sp. VKM Ac-2986]